MRELLIKFRGDRTQAEMAARYGVTQQAWNTWEKGQAYPRPNVMMQISKDSGYTMEDIYFDSKNKENLSDETNDPPGEVGDEAG